jgi:hypothetical protein
MLWPTHDTENVPFTMGMMVPAGPTGDQARSTCYPGGVDGGSGRAEAAAAPRGYERAGGSRALGASPHLDLAGWLRADVPRARSRPRAAIHGCRSLLGCEMKQTTGSPDPKHIRPATSSAKTTMRMSMRSFSRLTNAFSKKVENHAAAIALYFMYYNCGRVHQTLRVTPAMEAGVANHVWNIEEIVTLLG